MTVEGRRPAALITGAGRKVVIAAGIAARLADDGWNLALSSWRPYDARPRCRPSATTSRQQIAADLRARGATVVLLHADLADPAVPDRLVADAVGGTRAAAGPRPVTRRVARLRDPRHDGRVVGPPLRGQRPGELAAHRGVRAPGDRRWRDRRPDQRPCRPQPAVRLVQGRPGPDRPCRGRRAGRPGHPGQRGQPGPGRYRLDERRGPRDAGHAPAVGPPRDARGRREARLVPALGRWRLDDRPADPHRRRVLELARRAVGGQLAGAYSSVTCAAGSGSLDVSRSWWATAIMMHMSPSVVIFSVPARP